MRGGGGKGDLNRFYATLDLDSVVVHKHTSYSVRVHSGSGIRVYRFLFIAFLFNLSNRSSVLILSGRQDVAKIGNVHKI